MPQFARHQQPRRGVRHLTHHAGRRGVGPVRGPEGVVDVSVARRRQGGGERGVAGLFAGVEAQVLEQHRAAAAGLRLRRRRRFADGVGCEDHRPVEQFDEARGDRPQRQGRVRDPPGAAQMRGDDERGPALEGQLQGRHGRADAGVVADLAVDQGDVEIDAHEQPAPVEFEVVDGSLAHDRVLFRGRRVRRRPRALAVQVAAPGRASADRKRRAARKGSAADGAEFPTAPGRRGT